MNAHCLQCFERGPVTRIVCPRCGYVNDRSRRTRYWNRLPRLVRLERALKSCVGVLTLALCAMILLSQGHGGTGAGWAMIAPCLPGAAIWATVSGLTAHGRFFRARVFWGLVFVIAATVFALLGALEIGLILLLVGGIVQLAGLCASRWKRRLLARLLDDGHGLLGSERELRSALAGE